MLTSSTTPLLSEAQWFLQEIPTIRTLPVFKRKSAAVVAGVFAPPLLLLLLLLLPGSLDASGEGVRVRILYQGCHTPDLGAAFPMPFSNGMPWIIWAGLCMPTRKAKG